jgi:predicted dehydrogenase
MGRRRIGIGLIGCGRISHAHFNAYKDLNDLTNLVAVVDTDEERARKACEEADAKKYYLSVEELLMDDKVEAVDICLPHRLHHDTAIQALNAKPGIVSSSVESEACMGQW